MRITQKDLENTVKYINNIFNQPTEPYIKNETTGKYEPQAGVFLLDMAYGGTKLTRMSLDNGCTGQSEVTKSGFTTKKILYHEMRSFIEGVLLERENKGVK
jgi:hypothetical protein